MRCTVRVPGPAALPVIRGLAASTTAASLQRVRLHDCDPCRVVLSPNHRCVVPRGKVANDRRFGVIRRRYGSSNDLSFLSAGPPIIVSCDEAAVAVVELKSWVGQGAVQRQGRTNRAHDHLYWVGSDHNQAAD